MNETERVNINFVETDFKLLIDELYRITNLNISVDEKNKKFVISENNDIKYDLTELSSGQKKLLVIWFKIVEIRLFRKDKCATLLLFIDEIDNSFSPKWQEKFTYLLISLSQDLSNEKITHQFFISTHSPFILKNFLRKERNSDTVIINVENGKNIREDKKLLLNDNSDISYDTISYDEISYLYYDVATPNYYISLYEELKSKIDVESYKKVDNWLIMNKDKINEIIKEKELDKMTPKIEKIKCINHYKLNNDGEINENVKDSDVNLWMLSTNLTRLRHMFAHAWKKEKNFLFHKKHPEQFKNGNDDEIAETNEFYSFFEKENITNEEIESQLKKYIELIRLVLIIVIKSQNKSQNNLICS